MSTDKTEQALRSALERTLWNFKLMLERKPVRDASETISEAEAALAAAPPAQQQSEPREADDAMVAAAAKYAHDHDEPAHKFYRGLYRAMVAAATPPSLQEPQEAGRNV